MVTPRHRRQFDWCVLPICLLCEFIFWLSLPALSNAAPLPRPSVTETQQLCAPPLLAPGGFHERPLRRGESCTYQLQLEAGLFCRLLLEGTNVRIRLTAPHGPTLIEKNSDHFYSRESRLDWLTERAGVYQLEITHHTPQNDGRITVQFETAQPARPADAARLQARRSLDEAETRALYRQSVELRRSYLPKLAALLPVWQKTQDWAGAGDTEFLRGQLHFFNKEQQAGGQALEAALDFYQRANATQDMAKTHYELARFWRTQGNLPHAQLHFEQSLALRRTLNQPRRIADSTIALGRLLHSQGEYQKAIENYSESLVIYRAVEDLPALAIVLENLAEIYQTYGEPERVVTYLEEALALHARVGDVKNKDVPQLALGTAYYELGRYEKARSYLQEAVQLLQAQQSRDEGTALSNLGNVYRQLGQTGLAIETYLQALRAERSYPNDYNTVDIIYLRLCDAYLAQGEQAKAQQACASAIEIGKKTNHRAYTSLARSLLGTIARQRGDYVTATTHFVTALAEIESLRSNAALAAQRAALLGNHQQIYAGFICLLLEQQRHAPQTSFAQTAFHVSERAHARSLLESLREARVDLRASLAPELREREKQLLKSLEAQAAEQAKLQAGSPTPGQSAASHKVLAELTAAYEQLQTQIRQQNPHYAALTQAPLVNVAEIQKRAVDTQTLLLEYMLGEEESYLFTLTGDSLNWYKLPGRSQIEAAANRFYESLTARQRGRFNKPAERAQQIAQADRELSQAGAELSQMILAPAAAELKNRHLIIVADGKLQLVPFAALPAPASANQPASKPVRRNNPHSALGKPKLPIRYLIEDHVISYLPSATVLAVLREELKGRAPAPKLLAVFADPVFAAEDERLAPEVRDRLAREGQLPANQTKKPEPPALNSDLTRAIRHAGVSDERGGLERLPYTRTEAEAILKLAPKGQTYSALDFAANQNAALDPQLSQYRYVHFATHGLIDNTTPDLSGLVLSRLDAQGRELDGHLRLVEIYNMHLPAELVVLSACQTGLGKEVRGEGLMSLMRGFMYAGAARVLVSLWEVNDKSTANLMSGFYRGLLRKPQGLSPAAALRAAQLQMLKLPQWRAPFYWAAFVQHGEPR
jgi:CHAT domain-containing protein/tetratricopeptide (TPR) repeat protein